MQRKKMTLRFDLDHGVVLTLPQDAEDLTDVSRGGFPDGGQVVRLNVRHAKPQHTVDDGVGEVRHPPMYAGRPGERHANPPRHGG